MEFKMTNQKTVSNFEVENNGYRYQITEEKSTNVPDVVRMNVYKDVNFIGNVSKESGYIVINMPETEDVVAHKAVLDAFVNRTA